MKLPDAPFYGWISPEGKVWDCGPDDHVMLSYEIIAQLGYKLGEVDGLYGPEPVPPDDKLYELGWLKLDDDGSAWHLNGRDDFSISVGQITALLEIGDKHEYMRDEAYRTIKRYNR